MHTVHLPAKLDDDEEKPDNKVIFASALLQFPLLIFQYVEIDFIQNYN